ncbi:MAG: GGDEF domain-containing protein [Bryobacteraceae bacterium]
MALVSIKPFLALSEEEAAYRKALSMLLDGVAAYALELDRDARQSFRERIGEIRQGMGAEDSVETVLANAESAVQAIGDYARQGTRMLQTQGAEMQNTIALLSRTAVDMGGLGARAVARLRKIGDDVERAATAQGVSNLKAQLRKCLGDIQEEAKQQKAESDRMTQALQRELIRKQEAWRSVGLDPITDLPCELVAQAQFLSALRSGGQKHVAVFVLSEARRINLRFGRAAGDEVVRALKQYIAGHLASTDRLFRWSGPAIVASLASAESSELVRARLKRFLEMPIERTFEVNGRPASISLSIAWSIFALSPHLADLNRQINDFIASQGCRDEDPIPA